MSIVFIYQNGNKLDNFEAEIRDDVKSNVNYFDVEVG